MTALRDRQLAHLRDPGQRPALLLVDIQRDFGDPETLRAQGMPEETVGAVALAVERAAGLVEVARARGIDIVWVELASRADRPWPASDWLMTGRFEATGASLVCAEGTAGAEWLLSPAADEIRVRKRGYSGFFETPLAELLRAAGITWLTVAGLTTECCVAATVVDAMQRDWPVVVATDATAAYGADVHDAALRQLALTAALVAGSGEIVDLWKDAA